MLHFTLLLLGLSYEAASSEITDTSFKKGNSIQGCQLPDHPTNGKYDVLTGYQKKTPGDLINHYTILIYSCDIDFYMTAPYPVCTSENTWSTTPECLKRCSMVTSNTVNFECFSSRGIGTACLPMLPSGSVVLSSCKEGHVFLGRDIAVLTCRNGYWNKETPACHADVCIRGKNGECAPLPSLPQGVSSQPSASVDEDVQQAEIVKLVAQDVILGDALRELNIYVREQLSNISNSQANMVQEYQMQDTRLLNFRSLLHVQKMENSNLRTEMESLKTLLLREIAKQKADSNLQLMKSELDLLKSAQAQEVAKLNSEISILKTELESLKNEQTKLATKSLRVPYSMSIPGGVYPGWSVTVNGMMLPEATVFAVNLESQPPTSIAFHFRPYFVPNVYIVRNHFHNGAWANDETNGVSPLRRSQPFQIKITVETTGFKVDVNNKFFCNFNHRLPYQGINNFLVVGDAILTSVSTM